MVYNREGIGYLFAMEKNSLYLGYFKDAEKRREDRLIGGEYEHLILDEKYQWTSYDDVAKILSTLIEGNWEADYLDGVLLGAHAYGVQITLEPGSQFELSLSPQKTVEELERIYLLAMRDVLKAVKKHGKKIYALGYQPMASLDEIQLIDKKRYHHMYSYFKKRGPLAHNMMKASAATQIAVDFVSEEDFREIYQLMIRMGPFLSLIFDNTPVFEGKVREDHLFRTKIWMHLDEQRSGYVKGSFKEDFGYEDYVKHIFSMEPILMVDEEGEVSFTDEKKAETLLPQNFSKPIWEHVLSMGFFDVRAKYYLEIRMMDSVPYPLNFAQTALIKAIVYGKNRDKFVEKFFTMDETTLKTLKEDIIKNGFKASYEGETVLEICRWIVSLALQEEESHYLKPIQAYLDQDLNPSLYERSLFNEKGVDAMMKSVEITENILERRV